jgi:AcrR family transcriptional regulator
LNSKDAILKAALRCFDEKGFDATTTSLICDVSGVSNGSLFHHFGSKDELAAALYFSSLEAYQNSLIGALKSSPNGQKGISALIRAHIKWVINNRAEARFMFYQSQAAWLTAARNKQNGENSKLVSAIEAWLTPLMSSGQIYDMSALILFSQVIGPAQQVTRIQLTSGAGGDLGSYEETLINCAVRAVVVTPSL